MGFKSHGKVRIQLPCNLHKNTMTSLLCKFIHVFVNVLCALVVCLHFKGRTRTLRKEGKLSRILRPKLLPKMIFDPRISLSICRNSKQRKRYMFGLVKLQNCLTVPCSQICKLPHRVLPSKLVPPEH